MQQVDLWGCDWIQQVGIKRDVNLSIKWSILLSTASLHIQLIPSIKLNQCSTGNSSFVILMHMRRADIDFSTSVSRVLPDVLLAAVVPGEGVQGDAVNTRDARCELSWKGGSR